MSLRWAVSWLGKIKGPGVKYSSPATYIEPADNSELGRFLISLFQSGKREKYCSATLSFAKNLDWNLTSFPRAKNSYTRTIVARQEGGFEAMVARWDAGMSGLVHGHPDYAFYHLIEGRLGIEHFTPGSDGPELVTSSIMEPGSHFCVEGTAGRFDNAIHRITALEASLSLHMYSDDALLGKCYRDYPEDSPFLRKMDREDITIGLGGRSGR